MCDKFIVKGLAVVCVYMTFRFPSDELMLRIKNSLQKSDDWSRGKCQKGKYIRSNELVVKRDDGILMGTKMNECASITREEPTRHFNLKVC
jgi:hypothetical protein